MRNNCGNNILLQYASLVHSTFGENGYALAFNATGKNLKRLKHIWHGPTSSVWPAATLLKTLALTETVKIFVPDVLLGEDDLREEDKMVACALKSWPPEVESKTLPAGVGSSLYLWSIISVAAHDECLFFITHFWKMGWKVSVDHAASFRTARNAAEVTLLLQPDVASMGEEALWMWIRTKPWSSVCQTNCSLQRGRLRWVYVEQFSEDPKSLESILRCCWSLCQW